MSPPTIERLGRTGYAEALRRQLETHERVHAARQHGGPVLGTILVVEHDPVITRTRKSIETGTLVASEDTLSHRGVALHDTDRGGDITYHGPGQVVCYPIIDLNAAGLRIHAYIRLLEQAIIDTLADLGIDARRDPGATGVWVEHEGALAKIAAIGVRVRRWITLHGLALNVDPDLDHFSLIVPCGLAGRPVTSLARVLGDSSPSVDEVGDALAARVAALLVEAAETRPPPRL